MSTSKHALVVDDSASMRQMVSFTLRDAGFTVTEAKDGADALRLLDAAAPRIVITDLNMPVMNGIELIRQIRARPSFKFTPILMLTTESTDAVKAQGRAAGATGWIVKPFDPQKLVQVVNKVLP
ncbi:MAG: response regulator [Phycisphaerae bacterium]|nr:response regulator [Gemmatimonadaceae bacterium]